MKTFWKHFENILKTFWKHFENIMKTFLKPAPADWMSHCLLSAQLSRIWHHLKRRASKILKKKHHLKGITYIVTQTYTEKQSRCHKRCQNPYYILFRLQTQFFFFIPSPRDIFLLYRYKQTQTIQNKDKKKSGQELITLQSKSE